MNASGVAVSAPTKPEIVMSGKEASDQALFTGTASIDMAVPEGASATHRHAARVASPGARGDDLPGPPVRRLCVLLTVARPIGASARSVPAGDQGHPGRGQANWMMSSIQSIPRVVPTPSALAMNVPMSESTRTWSG
jgi:hypothetical protein